MTARTACATKRRGSHVVGVQVAWRLGKKKTTGTWRERGRGLGRSERRDEVHTR